MVTPRLYVRGLLVLCFGAAFSGLASGQTIYNDTVGTDHYGGPEVDIANVVVSNDATNITFQINLNTAATIGPTANHFANYEVGIQVGGGAGGQTAINGNFTAGDPTAGNPYGSANGISTGENFFIGNFLDGTGFSGGAQLYGYSSSTGWTQIGSTAPITEVYTGTPSTTFSFPLAALGLSVGNSLKFDVWTTFGSPQSAYDALDNLSTPPGTAPFNAGASYDSATAAGSALASYTVVAPTPEPVSAVTFGIAGLALLSRRRRH
ncbi:MAG TPA: hypothetical protein VHS31_19005 [Tepidisphaeraceae bacterium]|jgi:hypothetical protein|nr:hypothetical protein [Tepidisphaeraceae bacterium]